MPEFTNDLTPAEAERLALLMEEMGEAIQACGKVLRHGYESRDPRAASGGITNREAVVRELGNVSAAVTLMVGAGDVTWEAIEVEQIRKLSSAYKKIVALREKRLAQLRTVNRRA